MSDHIAEVFISYCWANELVAKTIYDHLHGKVNLHLDKLDIGSWKSIKEYMHSIPNMDYTILLISDAYLKSANCMYEVLEVLRDRNYKDKIFPVVIDKQIYDPMARAEYVKYWQKQYLELKESLQEIDIQNMGKLGDDLKRRQDIASNVANFLEVVSDMNNPAIADVALAIEQKLSGNNLIQAPRQAVNTVPAKVDWFSTIGIPRPKGQITDLEKNQFVTQSFGQIISTLKSLCEQFQNENPQYFVAIDSTDSKGYSFQFYYNGSRITGIRLFLDESFGAVSIGLSNELYPLGSTRSWNGLYMPEVIDGNLTLSSLMSLYGNSHGLTVEDIVKEIWMEHIKPRLDR